MYYTKTKYQTLLPRDLYISLYACRCLHVRCRYILFDVFQCSSLYFYIFMLSFMQYIIKCLSICFYYACQICGTLCTTLYLEAHDSCINKFGKIFYETHILRIEYIGAMYILFNRNFFSGTQRLLYFSLKHVHLCIVYIIFPSAWLCTITQICTASRKPCGEHTSARITHTHRTVNKILQLASRYFHMNFFQFFESHLSTKDDAFKALIIPKFYCFPICC